MRHSILVLSLPAALGAVSAHAQPSPAADLGRVEITSQRDNDQQQRRESTASKLVIGREEIERQGDANVGEILKRQPGISIGGPAGRGGGIRMRGLSQGYTQILLDGQRVPPGFSVESLTPEMIERIEIYRAPTAETGAQAIAGTINIVTREGRKGMPSELKAGLAHQGGYVTPTVSYVQYQDHDRWSANYTLSVNRYNVPDHSESYLSRNDGTVRERVSSSHYAREGLHATSRLQFKGAPGESLTLMPFVAFSQGGTPGSMWASQALGANTTSTLASTQVDNRFAVARLNGQWKRKLSADSNMEWKFNVGGWGSHSKTAQVSGDVNILPSIHEDSRTQDRSVNLGGKYTNVLGGGHQWVSGVEVEGVRRTQAVTGVYDTAAGILNATGSSDLRASSRRYALYSQDEWQFTPHWSTHLGARYESLTTEGSSSTGDVVNRNSVFTPLLHAMWRPNPDSRDQVRMSLTRSFKTPSMPSLLARRTYTKELNSETNPDTSGNPQLKPEVATGLDVALERYLPQGGVLSASAFYRRVQNLIRNQLIDPANDSQNRWLSMPMNISDAMTQGLELEAKFRLNQWIESAPAVDLRHNVSFYHSRVLKIEGPNNRLDQQPGMTLNLGADYRLRSMPLTLGGNYNYNPGYTTRSSEVQWLTVSQKRVTDVYGLWRVDNSSAWRLTLSNLIPRDYTTGALYDSGLVREKNDVRNRSWTNVQIQWEKKL